tara:strand:- start:98 stop:304 length:207 start_codon:yes stop_codon:yes gene_type:complete
MPIPRFVLFCFVFSQASLQDTGFVLLSKMKESKTLAKGIDLKWEKDEIEKDKVKSLENTGYLDNDNPC